MALGYATTLRNAQAQAIIDAIDAGAGAGVLEIYDGARPATGGAVTTLLASLPLSDPSGSVSGGVLTFNAITADSSADATGTATWARITDSNGTFVMDLDVTGTGGGGEIELDNTSINAGQQVNISSGSITIGNA